VRGRAYRLACADAGKIGMALAAGAGACGRGGTGLREPGWRILAARGRGR
jgi:hypothetical protein